MRGNENEALVDLIRAFLKTEILDKEGNSYTCQEKGIPQGSPIPPVLMNCFVHQLAGYKKKWKV